MNLSFLALGLFMVVGAVLLYRQGPRTRMLCSGWSFMALAGIGTLLVGLFPENTVHGAHVLGAGLTFLFGNLALLLLAFALRLPKALRWYTAVSGFIGLVALALFMTHHYSGIGIGGMERFCAYPQTIWLIIFGSSMVHRYKGQQNEG